jgi:hypothetical protein
VARKFAQIKVAIWIDDDFRTLSDSAQALYFRLLTSARLNFCGVTDWRPKRLAQLAGGLTERKVIASGEELERRGYVVLDEDSEEVLIRSFMRHDGILASPNLVTALVNDYGDTNSAQIRRSIITELHRLHDDQPDLKGWEKAAELLALEPSPEPAGRIPEGVSEGVSGRISPLLLLPQITPTPEPIAASGLSEDFDKWYSIYPRKAARPKALTSYKNARKRTDAETLLAAARAMAKAYGSDTRFCPFPATWLNQERWADPVTIDPQARVNDGRPEGW